LSRGGESWCYRPGRTGVLCAVSGGLARELRTQFPHMASRVRTVANGVDTAEFGPDPVARQRVRAALGIGPAVPLAVFAGGDWERKGVRHAVRALAQAQAWHLAVAGEGDAEPLLAEARAEGTDARLHLLGPRRDMPAVYAASDAFVLPTAYETFSLVTYEAAASGLPLLVTRVSGVEDLLEDGHSGWFVTPDAGEIAGRLRALSADAEMAAAMGRAARAAAVRFSWEAMVAGYLEVYAAVDGPV
jgi:glycosyltransferase involved in cell wall biosynthesis